MKYLEYWANLKETNRILVIVLMFLIALVAVLVMGILALAKNREVVVYMPPYEKVRVGGKEFVLLWARTFVDYLTNYTPETVEERYKFLATFAYDEELKQKLLLETQRIKKERFSQQFIPYEGTWELNPETREISVKGLLKRWVGTKLVETKNDAKVKLYMRIYAGKPYLVGFEYE